MTASIEPLRLRVVDMHTAGEPVRIVEEGYPALEGTSILARRRDARERLDHLRRMLMLEPRGHTGMYGVIPTAPGRAGADLAVLFTHQEGYSTMCGHATIAIGRWAVDSGRIALVDGRAAFGLEAPCGLVEVEVVEDGHTAPLTSFVSVASFASHLDQRIEVPGWSSIAYDIAFGGAYYAILPASRLGLSLMDTPVAQLVEAGAAITGAVRATVPIDHPSEPDLGFLYGTILTDDIPLGGGDARPSYNLCVFAEGQIDRSPTGSGVTARFALAAARGEIRRGDSREIRGVSGEGFVGTLWETGEASGQSIVRVKVAGRSYYAGRAEFVAEGEDAFAYGFALPARFADLPAS